MVGEVLPLRKKRGGGAVDNLLTMLRGWGTTSFGVVLTRELEGLALQYGAQNSPPFKNKG